jgi:hypothetical protein
MEQFFSPPTLPQGEANTPSDDKEQRRLPRRFRVRLKDGEKHPNGSDSRYFHGCYFPLTDLCITEMARPGTGEPSGVEWLDEKVER